MKQNLMNGIQVTLFTLLFLCLLNSRTTAQRGWSAGISTGPALPITGYKGVVKNDWLFGAEGAYRFGTGRFAVGMKIAFAQLNRDQNPSDTFENARMDLIPVLFTAEWQLKTTGAVLPYLGGGLGLSFFNFNYELSATQGHTDFNVSFAMAPRLGVRFKASDHIFPFIEGNLVLLADGPPQGFPKAGKMTGYAGIEAGLAYRF